MNHPRAWSRAVDLALAFALAFAFSIAGPGLARGDETGVVPGQVAAPPPCVVTIVPGRRTLTLGTDTGTTLLVTATGPLGAGATAGRTLTTVGAVEALVPGPTPGSFTTEYHVPPDRRPQSAIVAAELLLPDGRRVHAVTHLMLPAETNFPLRSSPNASVSVEVAGRVFGPRKADAEGNVQIPIVVPPDVAVGHARAISAAGIEKQTDVSLQPQEYPRVLVIAPPDAEVGADVDVEVWAIAAGGEPSPPEEIDLWVESGKIRRSNGIPGRAGFTFTVPGRVGAGALALVGSMQDGTSAKRESIRLHTATAASLSFSTDVPQLVVGSKTAARLTLRAHDRFGNVVSTTGVEIQADGHVLPFETVSGAVTTTVDAPERWPGVDHIAVTGTLGQARATTDIALTGGTPARLSLVSGAPRVDGDGKTGVDFLLEIFDQRGSPTSTARMEWRAKGAGSLEILPPPRFGAYAARFVPKRTLRDRSATVLVAVEHTLTASARIEVGAGAAHIGSARAGIASNLGSLSGEAVFVEATLPLRRWGGVSRLFSAGASVGYVHSEMTSSPASTFSPVHVEVTQAPVLAVGRLRVSGELPVELSLLAAAGLTFAMTSALPSETSFPTSNASARSLVLGGGLDANMVLQPGELVVGARYLYANLGRTSNGDHLAGNALGLICDIGFRLGF